ncbi:SET domain-containing protein [Mycena chlorophos]|uniref:SET domain-containing protein n=1 Tax=Mycena chlorophos TaxID=658473 RepID=A0A8H6SHT2_MYCCL|nr:SET domain-containing protein [Mycena chlorophos]
MSLDADISALIAWCSSRNVWIDPRLRIVAGPHGVAVYSRGTSIPSGTTLVRIPRASVLSVKSSPISHLIPASPYGRSAQLSLALALSVELANGEMSAWHGYLQSLPRDIPGLFWAGATSTRGDSFTTGWLAGTEAAKLLANLDDEIEEYYRMVARPMYEQLRISRPSLQDFRHVCGLVSSRAFLVDAYHGLSMVPIADAFNHIQDNHVHIETDFDVCPECGSLRQCPHDDDTGDGSTDDGDDDQEDTYEMVSNRPIPAGSEIFNTYGETLSNAQLFVQYGFVLDVNENDCITFSSVELAEVLGGDRVPDQLLNSLTALPWDDMVDSELVYVDGSRRFCINSDALISHSLWLLLALHLLPQIPEKPHDSLIRDLENAFHHQLTLERCIGTDSEVVAPTPPVLDDEADAASSPNLYGIIPNMARLLVSLCRRRAEALTGCGKSSEELGDIFDSLPVDGNPTRMAISLVLTERSLLDSCAAAWESAMRATR